MIKKLLVILLTISFISCEQKESEVLVELLPQSPVVIDADYKYISALTLEEETVSKPWFSIRIKVKNNSKKIITIAALTLEILGVDKGSPTVGDSEIVGEGDANNNPIIDTNCDNNVDPSTDVLGVLYEIGPGVGCVSNIIWYIGSLPKDDDFIYTVRGRFVGWYNAIDSGYLVPDERLEVNTMITTR